MQNMCVWSLDQEDPLKEEMPTHTSIFAWEIPWTEESGGLQSMGIGTWQDIVLGLRKDSDMTWWLNNNKYEF